MNGGSRFRIRRGTAREADAIFRVKAAAVRGLCGQDYGAEQIEAWTRKGSPEELERKLTADATFVAVSERDVIGYCEVRETTGEVLAVYVLPTHVRLGVGAALLAAAEEHALAFGLDAVWLDASLTAQRFYAAQGYALLRATSFSLEAGVELPCLRMSKKLGPASAASRAVRGRSLGRCGRLARADAPSGVASTTAASFGLARPLRARSRLTTARLRGRCRPRTGSRRGRPR